MHLLQAGIFLGMAIIIFLIILTVILIILSFHFVPIINKSIHENQRKSSNAYSTFISILVYIIFSMIVLFFAYKILVSFDYGPT